jgi:hypothetical protein
MLSESGPSLLRCGYREPANGMHVRKGAPILGSDFSGDLIPIALFLRWLCAAAR